MRERERERERERKREREKHPNQDMLFSFTTSVVLKMRYILEYLNGLFGRICET